MRDILLLITTLLACQPEPVDETDLTLTDPDTSSVDSGEGSSWITYKAEEPEPLLSLDEVGAQFEQFIASGTPNPWSILDGFMNLMEHGEGACPGDSNFFDDVYLGCETTEGYFFTGIAWFYQYDNTQGFQKELLWEHGGDFEIIRPDGTGFGGGGEILYYREPDRLTQSYQFLVEGSWFDHDQPGWLAEGFSGVLTGRGHTTPSGTGILELNGGLSVGDLDLYMEHTTWIDSDHCAQGIQGSLHLYDGRGYWYNWHLGEDCDACGPLLFNESEPMGDLCLDLSDYASQMVTAWEIP